MTLVLHTHSRRLDFHPHIHVVMPGGVIDHRHQRFKSVKGRYLFNEFALAKVFRAKCLHAMKQANLTLPRQVPHKWVAHCQYAGKGEPALRYLARYLYRGVISESNIVHADDDHVTFSYRDSQTKTTKLRTLKATEFVWKVLSHVLPRGYQRVRHYGFLHHNAAAILRLIQLLLHVVVQPQVPVSRPEFTCHCGHGEMKLVAVLRRSRAIRFQAARASPT